MTKGKYQKKKIILWNKKKANTKLWTVALSIPDSNHNAKLEKCQQKLHEIKLERLSVTLIKKGQQKQQLLKWKCQEQNKEKPHYVHTYICTYGHSKLMKKRPRKRSKMLSLWYAAEHQSRPRRCSHSRFSDFSPHSNEFDFNLLDRRMAKVVANNFWPLASYGNQLVPWLNT